MLKSGNWHWNNAYASTPLYYLCRLVEPPVQSRYRTIPSPQRLPSFASLFTCFFLLKFSSGPWENGPLCYLVLCFQNCALLLEITAKCLWEQEWKYGKGIPSMEASNSYLGSRTDYDNAKLQAHGQGPEDRGLFLRLISCLNKMLADAGRVRVVRHLTLISIITALSIERKKDFFNPVPFGTLSHHTTWPVTHSFYPMSLLCLTLPTHPVLAGRTRRAILMLACLLLG